jgi:hypothetical protein
MLVHTFIFSWKGVTANACNLYNSIKTVCPLITIINCDENSILPPEYNSIQLDDSYYYGGQFNTAMQYVEDNTYMWCVVGDVSSNANWHNIYTNAVSAFKTYPIGIYAPNVDYTSHISKNSKLNNQLWHVDNTDCTCWCIHPSIISSIKHIPFRILSNLGWGIDVLVTTESKKQSKFVIRDYSETVYQPKGTNYSSELAKEQLIELMLFYRTNIF